MNRTQTLAAIFALFFTMPVLAQYTQNFESATITSGCNNVTNVTRTTLASEVINGSGSLLSSPPVNGNGTRDFYTSYLNVNTLSTTVTFNYKLTEALNGQATRTIEVGYQGTDGVFHSLDIVNMNKDNDPTGTTPYTGTFSIPQGANKIVLKMGGGNGNGAARIVVDDIVVSASSYYATGCNAAPTVRNDNYSTPMVPVYTGTTVLANDFDSNGETLGIPTLTTPSPDGTVVLNSNGTFTFTPNAGFSGASTTFTYTVYDNGLEPMSGTATVTIFFQSLSPLPVKLLSFGGSLSAGKVQLTWTVGENETGDHFEIEKSSDGIRFTAIARTMVTAKSGEETYQFTEAQTLGSSASYRIRIVNRDGSFYSKIVLLRADGKETTRISAVRNPIVSQIAFSYSATETGMVTVTLYNMQGAQIQATRISTVKGINAVSLPVTEQLAPGTYLLEVRTATDRNTIKVLK